MTTFAQDVDIAGARSYLQGTLSIPASFQLIVINKSRDLVYGGMGRIPVLTAIDDSPDQPVSCKVVAARSSDNRTVRQIVTAADGTGVIEDLDPRYTYNVQAFYTDDTYGVVGANDVPCEV